MRVLLWSCGSRGDVQPLVAVRLRTLGVEMRMCAPPDGAVDCPLWTFDRLSAALTTALAPETRARAAVVVGTVRADGTTVAAELLFDAVSREKPSVSV